MGFYSRVPLIKGLWGLVLGFYEGVWVSGPMKGFGLRV